MKRIITCLLSVVMSLGTYAQITSGYYRLQCKETGRYLAIHNDYVNKESAKRTGQVELQSLETIEKFDSIVNDPGSIIYIKNMGYGYAIEGQGFTTEGRLNLQITKVKDAYRLWTTMTYEGVQITRYLRDYKHTNGKSYVTTDESKSKNWDWYIIPVDGDQYFGLRGDVKVGENYFTTLYAKFPVKLGSGMKAYTVNTLTESTCTLKDIGNTVPAKTPVVIACAGKETSANKVTPLKSDDAAISDNKLKGVTFCYPVILPNGQERRDNPAWNAKDYVPATMRVLGEADGKLCFITASSDLEFLAANRAYLPVSKGSAGTIPTDGTTEIRQVTVSNANQASGTYTLNGVRLPDNVTPQKGIYIQDGKKIAIK